MSSPAETIAAAALAAPRPPRDENPAEGRRRERLAVAEALGIPWERLLEAEIQAERTLRGFVGDPSPELPLWRFLSALPTSALDSWRVRERISTLLQEARVTRSGTALRSVREAVDDLCGRREDGNSSENRALALHLRQAHERVRELARVARAAERCRGAAAEERLGRVVRRTGCTAADAAWAVARAEAPGRAHAIDDAVKKARLEGFDIPAASSEFHAFLALRKLLRRNPPSRRRPRAPRRISSAARRHRERLAS
ncbi:MAG TPA: hypothetical protein VEG84_09225 [Thermoanaerobaculia bacterium]|nr:hypothetical protein [Thermoanaerobaculia bacterium]